MRAVFAAFLLFAAAPAVAQDLVFDEGAVLECAARDAVSCIGAAARACMKDSAGGETTVGMGGCLDRELQVWDDLLNAAYSGLITSTGVRDAETLTYSQTDPLLQPALRDMQRAWITYRDATCDFERAQWGGGTGGGPATLSCLLDLTAAQARYLRNVRLGY